MKTNHVTDADDLIKVEVLVGQCPEALLEKCDDGTIVLAGDATRPYSLRVTNLSDASIEVACMVERHRPQYSALTAASNPAGSSAEFYSKYQLAFGTAGFIRFAIVKPPDIGAGEAASMAMGLDEYERCQPGAERWRPQLHPLLEIGVTAT